MHCGLQQITTKPFSIIPPIHTLVAQSALSRAAQATTFTIISFLILPSPTHLHHISCVKYRCHHCKANDVHTCTCNPIRIRMMLCVLSHFCYQQWASRFSTSALPSLAHISSNISRTLRYNPHDKREVAPVVKPTDRATAKETSTLLSLLGLLRCSSAPLRKLLSIARDSNHKRPTSLGEYVARHQGDWFCTQTSPIDTPEVSRGSASNAPNHSYGKARVIAGSHYERELTPPSSLAPENLAALRDSTPKDEEDTGTHYIWPYFYKGSKKWRYSP